MTSFADWELRDPWFLLAGLIVPLLWLLLRRSPGVVVYSSLTIPLAAPRSARARLAGLPLQRFSHRPRILCNSSLLPSL